MTREDYLAKLQALSASVESNIEAYNNAVAEDKAEDAANLDTKIEEEVKEHASIAQMLCFDGCVKAEDPMRAAVLTMCYKTIGFKDEIEEDGAKKTVKRVFDGDKVKMIDLRKLDKFSRDRKLGGIGKDANWIYKVDRLALLLSLNHAVEVGKGKAFIEEMSDCYAIKEAAKNIDFKAANPKAGTPISNTNLQKAMQEVVTAMLGEEVGKKVVTHDVRFAVKSTARVSGPKSIKVVTPAQMHKIMLGICNRIVTGSEYDVEYKAIKRK